MKKKRKPNIGKKLMSSVLAMTMAMELAPVAALTAKAAVSEETVTALAKAYDGDEERARAELEALYQSGIIDESGNMIVPEIRENGQIVSLDDVAVRIASGEEVGALTANGYAVTKNKIMQLSEAKGLFEVIRVMREGSNVEITEEHLSNYEQLKEKIKDGTIDLESIIMNGGTLSTNDLPDDESEQQEDIQSIDMLAMPRMLPAPLLAAAGNENANANVGGFPSTKTSEGEVETDADGKYTQPFIGGNNYENSHAFQLAEPENKTYYTDSQYEGIITDGVVSLSCADTATAGGTVTVTATLNKAQSVPVSFDWSAAGGSIGASGSGTVKWNAGETGAKTFTVNVAGKGDQLWDGKRSFVISVGNVKNALLSDQSTAWSKTVTVEAHDDEQMDRWVTIGTLPEGTTRSSNYADDLPIKQTNNVYDSYSSTQTINSMTPGCRVRLVMNLSGTVPEKNHFQDHPQPMVYLKLTLLEQLLISSWLIRTIPARNLHVLFPSPKMRPQQ